MKRLNYKEITAVITGASSGIGKSLASYLIQKYGANVIAVARSWDKLQLVKDELGEKYIPYSLDVTSKDGWDNLYSYLCANGIRVDLIVNCAGALPEFKSFEKTSIEEYEAILNLNTLAPAYAIKSLSPLLNEGGAVINISSASALCPFGGVSTYTASKGALENFSESLSCEYKNISVSCAMPGFVRTEIMKNQEISTREAKIIRFFSADPNKVSRKILRRASKRKPRIIVGADARLLNFLYKLLPRTAPRFITWILRKSKLSLFSKI
jgi:short-subunit dehydrogenase